MAQPNWDIFFIILPFVVVPLLILEWRFERKLKKECEKAGIKYFGPWRCFP